MATVLASRESSTIRVVFALFPLLGYGTSYLYPSLSSHPLVCCLDGRPRCRPFGSITTKAIPRVDQGDRLHYLPRDYPRCVLVVSQGVIWYRRSDWRNVGSAVAEKLEHLLSRVDGLMYLLRHTCGSHRVRGVSLLYEHTLKFIGCRPPTFGELDTTVTLAIAGTCRRMGLRRVRL